MYVCERCGVRGGGGMDLNGLDFSPSKQRRLPPSSSFRAPFQRLCAFFFFLLSFFLSFFFSFFLFLEKVGYVFIVQYNTDMIYKCVCIREVLTSTLRTKVHTKK